MPNELWQYLQARTPTDLGRDVLDVLITYYIFYRVVLVLKGTRAMQILIGLALVFVLYVVAQVLRLNTVLTILTAVLSSAILIGVVVFQNDIRRGLMRMGARARLNSGQTLEGKLIDDVVEAAQILARHRTGAIITFEREANLDEFVGSHQGHVIDAAVTPELLVSLFIPEAMNKLHDGALIIRDLRIAKAGVFFPMPEGRVADESFGSRHRAAMGITEETDAVVVVVSEERGTISFCFNGNIIANLDGPRLRTALEGVFAPKRARKREAANLFSRLRRLAGSQPPASTRSAGSRPTLSRTPKPVHSAGPRRDRPKSRAGNAPPSAVPTLPKSIETPYPGLEGRPTLTSLNPDMPLRELSQSAGQIAESPTAAAAKAVEPLRKRVAKDLETLSATATPQALRERASVIPPTPAIEVAASGEKLVERREAAASPSKSVPPPALRASPSLIMPANTPDAVPLRHLTKVSVSPQVQPQDLKAPDSNSPDTDSPDTDSPDTDSPDTDSPDTDSPDSNSPHRGSPGSNSADSRSFESDSRRSGSPDSGRPGQQDASNPVGPMVRVHGESERPAIARGPTPVPESPEAESAPREG